MKSITYISSITIMLVVSGCATEQAKDIEREMAMATPRLEWGMIKTNETERAKGKIEMAERIENAKIEGIPLLISSIGSADPNTAGGVDVYIHFINTSNQTMKYVLITAIPYNRVGDVESSEITDNRSVQLESIGPFHPGDGDPNTYWENVWYNHAITCIEVSHVKIIYMNGTSDSFTDAKLSKIIGSVENSCSVAIPQ